MAEGRGGEGREGRRRAEVLVTNFVAMAYLLRSFLFLSKEGDKMKLDLNHAAAEARWAGDGSQERVHMCAVLSLSTAHSIASTTAFHQSILPSPHSLLFIPPPFTVSSPSPSLPFPPPSLSPSPPLPSKLVYLLKLVALRNKHEFTQSDFCVSSVNRRVIKGTCQ